MPPRQIVYALIVFLHDLFTVVWIGGLVSLSLFVLPSAIHLWGRGPEARGLMDGIQRRLRVAVYVSIVGLLLTGILMSRRNPAFTGLFSVGNTYSAILAAKHIAVLSMVVVAL
ncbi:MAG TPA: hypothetical protein GX702_01705, partial [Chloroflexi bacterium]|nr:hypothetical protein [Chloroflexota bacterium]